MTVLLKLRRSPLGLVNLLYPPACLLCSARLPLSHPGDSTAAELPTAVEPHEQSPWHPRSRPAWGDIPPTRSLAQPRGAPQRFASPPEIAERFRGLSPGPPFLLSQESRGVTGQSEAWGADGGVVCEACAEAMPRSGRPICSFCGVGLWGAFDAILRCSRCRTRPLAFDLARAPWQYAGVAREAIHRFKYQRRWRLGRWLSDGMVMTARSSLPLDEVEAVLPVPLYWLKRRLKGENPAELLARSVACALKKAVLPHALRRTRWTASQTRLSWPARSRNVRAAFAASASAVSNRTLLLIDDVLTSGATAQACAVALKAAGARRVFVLTAARTPLAR